MGTCSGKSNFFDSGEFDGDDWWGLWVRTQDRSGATKLIFFGVAPEGVASIAVENDETGERVETAPMFVHDRGAWARSGALEPDLSCVFRGSSVVEHHRQRANDWVVVLAEELLELDHSPHRVTRPPKR